MTVAVVAAVSLFACDDAGSGGAGSGPARGVLVPELRTTRPLMEGWRFVKDDDLTDEAALAATGADWQPVTLPHTWNAQDAASLQAGDYARGLGWYRLELERPDGGARHWLEFGAASLVADVWLNGEELGRHRGGFTQFRFDVTERLRADGPNVLLVKVDNGIPLRESDPTAIDPNGGDFNRPGGLYRHVALVSTPHAVHFDLGDLGGPGVYAMTTAIGGGRATVNVRTRLRSDAARRGEFLVRVSLLDRDGAVAGSAQRRVELGPGADAEVAQDVELARPHLWRGVEDPYLYELVAELADAGGTPIDRVVQRFGIRQIRFDPEEGFFLNGEHVRLHGVAMHQDFLGKAWAVTDEDVETSLAFFTEIGANAIRLGHYPFSRYTLERVSELGLVAWAEKPSGLRTTDDPCARTQPTDEYMENARQQLQETIRQQYNHAAIAVWSIGNETTFSQATCPEPYDNVTPYLAELHAVAKAEDPTRPTVYAEFPHPVDERRQGLFETEGITDLFATNRYFLWYHEPFEDFSPLLDRLHELAGDQPLAVSEYGAGSALTHHTDDPRGGMPEVHSAEDGQISRQPEEYASYVHEQNYGVIASKRYLWGSFVWNMFDFGSANRNEGDVLGVNTKGLVTFDRRTRKDPFFFYKANWSGEDVTYVTGRRYTDRAYAVTDVKVYSNAESVELSVNGTPVGTMNAASCPQRTCLFEDVQLGVGTNEVSAVGNHAGRSVTDTVQWSVATTDVRVASGLSWTGYVASEGTRWGSDAFFTGGAPGQIDSGDAEGGIPPGITGTSDPQLFKFHRAGDEFGYDIPLPDGTYELVLGFLEPEEGARVGDRVFSVTVDGAPLLFDFDVVREAGAPLTAVTRSFQVNVAGGRLILELDGATGDAIVSNISLTRRSP